MAKEIWNFMRSIKLALFTMSLVAIYSIYGMVVNNANVFGNPVFLGLAGLFLINLLCCTLEQTRKFRLTQPIHKWGLIIFHWGLVVVSIGCMFSFTTRLEGYFIITEGETRSLEEGSFSQLDKALYPTTWPGWNLSLEDLQRHWRKDNSLNYTSSLVSLKGKDLNIKEWVEKGQPLISDNWRYFYYDAGYAPGVIVKKGNQVLGGFLLQGEKEKGQGTKPGQENGYTIKENVLFSDLVINGTFYPDRNNLSSEKLIQPALKVITKQGEKLVTPNHPVTEGNYSILLGDIKQWVGLQIVYDRGAGWVFAGAWLAVSGLVLWYYGRIIRRRHA